MALRRRTRLPGLRILVVEDDRELRECLAMLLRTEGSVVMEAGTGQEAETLARRGGFDVVVSDLGLPDVSGDTLVRRLVAASRGGTHIVVITGQTEPHLSHARAAGAHAVFTKPMEWDCLVACLDDLRLAEPA